MSHIVLCSFVLAPKHFNYAKYWLKMFKTQALQTWMLLKFVSVCILVQLLVPQNEIALL